MTADPPDTPGADAARRHALESSLPLRPGSYRRRILIRGAGGEVRADMEDDPHRYGIVLRHDGARVLSVEGLALRTPWTLCSGAVAMLQRGTGMPLSPHPMAVYRHTAGAEQCTHLFDLAALAVAHAARGTRLRQYDITVHCPAGQDSQHAAVERDGIEVLQWTFRRPVVLAPERFAGQSFRRILAAAERNTRDVDDSEAILVLHRGSFTSVARYLDLDRMKSAADIPLESGACYVYRRGTVEHALRRIGSTRDFDNDPGALLRDLQERE